MKQTRKLHAKRGYATITVLGATAFVLLAGGSVVMMTSKEERATNDQGQTIVARNLAEAGLDRAMLKLSQVPTWRNTDAAPEFTNAPVNATIGGKSAALGTFTVDQIVEMNTDDVQITAHGYYPNATAPNAVVKTLRIIANAHYRSSFNAGLFGKTEVRLSDGHTDSYDTQFGTYASQTPGHRGDIRVDAHDPHKIDVRRKGYIWGRVMFGPGTDLKKVVIRKMNIDDGDGNAANDISVSSSMLAPPPVVVPADVPCVTTIPGYTGTQDITTQIDIPAGTYWCNKIDLHDPGDYIRTHGKVVLYVKDDIHTDKKASGFHNNYDDTGALSYPSDLRVYCTAGCAHIDFHSHCPLTMVLYAPQTHIDIHDYDDDKLAEDDDDGDFYGSIVGDKVHFKHKSLGFHYDMALRRPDPGVLTPFKVTAWQDS